MRKWLFAIIYNLGCLFRVWLSGQRNEKTTHRCVDDKDSYQPSEEEVIRTTTKVLKQALSRVSAAGLWRYLELLKAEGESVQILTAWVSRPRHVPQCVSVKAVLVKILFLEMVWKVLPRKTPPRNYAVTGRWLGEAEDFQSPPTMSSNAWLSKINSQLIK